LTNRALAGARLAASYYRNWSILRFPFVYGDGDGHLQSLPKHVSTWHPAQRMSTIHHRDIAQAITLALKGDFDRRIVNLADEAPSSIYELAGMVGKRLDSSCEPLSNPWYLHVDTSLAYSLGFHPSIRTVYQAWQEGISQADRRTWWPGSTCWRVSVCCLLGAPEWLVFRSALEGTGTHDSIFTRAIHLKFLAVGHPLCLHGMTG